MKIKSDNGQEITFRKYEAEDFPAIQQLNALEGWNTLVERAEETKEAFEHSNVAYMFTMDSKVVGYLRGLTDTQITLYLLRREKTPSSRNELGIAH